MRKTREILRQKWCLGHSHREVARSLGQSVGAIHATLRRAAAAGLDWEAVGALPDEALDAKLYGAPAGGRSSRVLPDFAGVHAEHKRPGVTLELLHLEYLEQHPDGYGYTQFCEYYRRWLQRRRLSMRQIHRAGDKLFVDYAGKRPRIVDRATGEVNEVELFVAVLGASSFTYAEATRRSGCRTSWPATYGRFEFFGGVSAALVPDQLKSAVTTACRYEPGAQRTYEELAQHYGTAILPARPAKPRDKAKVEVAVQVAERWILARLRHETFFSLAALNRADPRAARGDQRPHDARVRREPAASSSSGSIGRRSGRCPRSASSTRSGRRARVNIDYHVELDRHYYSVPHALVHERVELRFTASTLEVFWKSQRVASHARSFERGRHTTIAEHMPKAHQKHLDVDALAADSLGGQHRIGNGIARRGDPGRPAAPRAGLPLVPRDPAPRQALRARAARGGLHARRGGARPLVPPRRIDPEARARSRAAAGARSPRNRRPRTRTCAERLLPTRSEARRRRC